MTTAKAKIVAELGAPSLLLPNLVADALAANARIKFALSWLQMAEALAASADGVSSATLAPERTLAGLGADERYASPVVIGRKSQGNAISRAGAIVSRLLDDLAIMRLCADAGVAAGLLEPARAAQFRTREETIHRSAQLDGDVLPSGFVSMLSRPPHEEQDTLHGLVMDLHKAVNTIGAAISTEDVAGANTYHITEDDNDLVVAFMRGLSRTAQLKFSHPGLATNVTRDGDRLMIQNDIGTTDAHVLIAYVEGLQLSIAYSDVHRSRLEFFERRLSEFSWTVSNRQVPDLDEDVFLLATGRLEAKDHAALEAALEHLGANLVFLIDWNKARKSLRRLMPKAAVGTLLDWVADHEIGHRGYLELGGDAMVMDLLENVSKTTGGFYTSLQAAVGEDGAVEFLRELFRIAADGLTAGRSAIAVRDMARGELLARVASIGDRILEAALDHAALILDLANLVRAALLDGHAANDPIAKRAALWENLADRQVDRIRAICGSGKERPWRAVASRADDAADNFEEVAFRLCFLPDDVPADVREGLLRLAEHTVAAVKDYVRLLCALCKVRRGSLRHEIREFLTFVERIHDQEHATDNDGRDVFACLMRANVSAKTLNVVSAVADRLEEVGDALLHSGRLLSDHALGEWFAV